MMLVFMLGTELVKVRIDDERQLSMCTRLTNGVFVPYVDLVRKSGQDEAYALLMQRHLSCHQCLPLDADVECYVRHEILSEPKLQAFGIRHVETQW